MGEHNIWYAFYIVTFIASITAFLLTLVNLQDAIQLLKQNQPIKGLAGQTRRVIAQTYVYNQSFRVASSLVVIILATTLLAAGPPRTFRRATWLSSTMIASFAVLLCGSTTTERIMRRRSHNLASSLPLADPDQYPERS